MALEHYAVDLTRTTSGAAIRMLVLKGPSHARWLYDLPSDRPYVDLDLLVHPDDHRGVIELVARKGFHCRGAGSRRGEMSDHASELELGSVLVDLHRRIPGIGLDPCAAFERLWDFRASLSIRGGDIWTLAPVHRAVHLALHPVETWDGNTGPLTDLERGLAVLPTELWRAAASEAAVLDALPAFAQGLRLVDRGRDYAKAFALPDTPPLDYAPPLVVRRLREVFELPTFRERVSAMVNELVPSRSFLRGTSALARRSTVGLVLAYLIRPAGLLRKLWRARTGFR
jgi:hypothetical protein